MKIKEIIKKSPLETVLVLLLILEFAAIIFCNISLTDLNLDCDNAKLMNHIVKMWEEKSIAIDGWSYKTTLEWDCTSIFALFIYGLTKNIYLSCGLSNILLAALLIGVVFFMFKGKRIIYPLCALSLMFIPYRTGMLDYFNMLFFGGSQYIIKIMIPLIFTGIILDAKGGSLKKSFSKTGIFYVFIYVVFLFVSTVSSGIYVTMCGIMPVCMGYLVYKFLKSEKIPLSVILLFGYTVFAALFGSVLNKNIMGGTRADGMVMIDVHSIHSNIVGSIIGMFELFGATTVNTILPVLSLDGVTIIARLCLVIVLLACAFFSIKKIFKGNAGLNEILPVSMFVWNCFILFVSNTRAGSETYEYRYHLIGMIPLICVAVICIIDALEGLKKYQYYSIMTVLILMTAFIFAGSYRMFLRMDDANKDLKEFVEYCDGYNTDFVYMYNESDEGDICRLLAGGNAVYMCICDDGSVWAYDYYEQYVDGAMQADNVIVALRDDKRDFEGDFIIGGMLLTEFDRVGNRTLYRF